MLFKQRFFAPIAAGEVTLAFRRWRRPTVRAGGTLQTAAGVLAIESVEVVDADEITTRDAHRAGFASREELFATLDGDAPIHRIAFHVAGDDPRIALRENTELADDERDDLVRRVSRMDGFVILELLRDHEAVRAADLATKLGMETLPFKAKVRRLKALGLTESLDIGYRLSPRGQALLRSRP